MILPNQTRMKTTQLLASGTKAAGLPTGDSNLLIGEGNLRKSDGSDTSCRSVMYVKLTAVDQNGEAVEICGAT